MANTPHWKLAQLQQIAAKDPLKVEVMLDSLWESNPELLAELAIAAVDQKQLEAAECAGLLRISLEELDGRLEAYRAQNSSGRAMVVVSDNQVAKLADGHVAVWEIVRELRLLGSHEKLCEKFPALCEAEIEAALCYAERNKSEIETLISRYESIVERRRAEYPFAKSG